MWKKGSKSTLVGNGHLIILLMKHCKQTIVSVDKSTAVWGLLYQIKFIIILDLCFESAYTETVLTCFFFFFKAWFQNCLVLYCCIRLRMPRWLFFLSNQQQNALPEWGWPSCSNVPLTQFTTNRSLAAIWITCVCTVIHFLCSTKYCKVPFIYYSNVQYETVFHKTDYQKLQILQSHFCLCMACRSVCNHSSLVNVYGEILWWEMSSLQFFWELLAFVCIKCCLLAEVRVTILL